jgi:outer membrane biosynthesis protein TonB
MRRSSLLAATLTVGIHAAVLGVLFLWSIVGTDIGAAPAGVRDPDPQPADPAAARDTSTVPLALPERLPAPPETTAVPASASTQGPHAVRTVTEKPRPAASVGRTQVTPILMLSWQKGITRRKTYGTLPTLAGPLAKDVVASFKVTVAPDGKVRRVRTVKRGDAAFEKAALAKIPQWKFDQFKGAGRPSDQLCTVTLRAKAR